MDRKHVEPHVLVDDLYPQAKNFIDTICELIKE